MRKANVCGSLLFRRFPHTLAAVRKANVCGSLLFRRVLESVRVFPWLRAAGGDSVPRDARDCSQNRSLDRDLDVSTSGKFAWLVVLQ